MTNRKSYGVKWLAFMPDIMTIPFLNVHVMSPILFRGLQRLFVYDMFREVSFQNLLG